MSYQNKGKLFLLSFFSLVLVLAGVYFYMSSKQKVLKGKLVFYYGEGCPHCAAVEDFMKQNDVFSKLDIKEKEVYYNRQNAEELMAKAKICGFNSNEIGVPFLWDNGKCIVGDQPIIDFLKGKLNEGDK